MKRKLLALVLIVIVSVIGALPVSAAPVNPTAIGFHSTSSTIPNFDAFYNLTSSTSGDVLFVAEGFVYYANPANEPTNIAGQSFNFEVLSPSNAIMLSVPLSDYGDRPISIYLTASQVSNINSQYGINIINNNSIQLSIAGNPAIFGTTTQGVNQYTQTVTSTNWMDESNGFSLSYNLVNDKMQNFMINMMYNINKYDSPTVSYLLHSAGNLYINDSAGTSGTQQSGEDILLQGIPNIQTWCSAIFKSSASPMVAGVPATTQSIQGGQSVQTMMGSTIANGLDGFRAYLGLAPGAGGKTMAGIIITVVACGFLVYYMTKKGFVDQRIVFIACVLVIVSFSWLGVFPISVLFIIAVGVAIYTLYYFWTRGIL